MGILANLLQVLRRDSERSRAVRAVVATRLGAPEADRQGRSRSRLRRRRRWTRTGLPLLERQRRSVALAQG